MQSEEQRAERDSASLLTAQRSTRTKYVLVVGIGYVLFAAHWARDSLGALELPLESAPMNLTVREYNSLSAGYFGPNLPTPLIAGMMAQKIGPGPVYVLFLAFALALS